MSRASHQHPLDNGSSNHRPFKLRETHLYLLLDDIASGMLGLQGILAYIQSLVVTETLVESVFVKGAMSRDAGRIPDDISLAVFQALSGLTQVLRLEISGDGRFGGLFLPVQAIQLALQQKRPPNKLQSLRLGNVILTCASPTSALRSATMQALAQSLRRLPNLISIDLVRCRTEEATTIFQQQQLQMTLQPIIQAIASMPSLQQVMLCETVISPTGTTGLYLGELCKSKSLQKLWWKTMPGMTDVHIVSMVESLLLVGNDALSLRELTIRSHGLGARAGSAIAHLLRFNTTIQVINLDLDQAGYGLVIAEALHHSNRTLQCLDVWAWGGELHPDSSLAITQVFTDMLQVNTSLRFLTFQGLDWTNPHIDFYLRLNRADRQRLVSDYADRKAWIDVLIKQRDDLDVVYHFLSLNPSILLGEDNNGRFLSSTRTAATVVATRSISSKRRKGPSLEGRAMSKCARRIIT
jgi:hypothetical protein